MRDYPLAAALPGWLNRSGDELSWETENCADLGLSDTASVRTLTQVTASLLCSKFFVRCAQTQGALMSTIKRLRAPLIVMSGALMSVAVFAGPANADEYTSPIVAPRVLGTTVTAVVPAAAAVVPAAAAVAPAAAAVAPAEVAGVSASAETSGLAFTGTNAIGIGALGGLLLVGGVTMVLVGKRRKVNA